MAHYDHSKVAYVCHNNFILIQSNLCLYQILQQWCGTVNPWRLENRAKKKAHT